MSSATSAATPKKGVAGREVPGATFAEKTTAVSGGKKKKKKKKGGRKHKKKTKPVKDADENGDEQYDTANEGDEPIPSTDVDDGESEGTVVENTPHMTTETLIKEEEAKEDVKNDDDAQSEKTIINDLLSADPSLHWSVPQTKETKEIRTTPAEWVYTDTAIGDIVDRTNANGTQEPLTLVDTKREAVAAWLAGKEGPQYRNIATIHKEKIIDHLLRVKYLELHTAEWTKALRCFVWRAVLRANFFWLDPFTNAPTGKPKPVLRPAGIYENHFEAFLECAAERLDRIGRDLPTPEYVKKVEDEVRGFLIKVEYAGKVKELAHLAFLLMFEEEQRKTCLGLEDLQDRIRRAFPGGEAEIALEEFEFLKRGAVPKVKVHPAWTVEVADWIWKEAKFELA